MLSPHLYVIQMSAAEDKVVNISKLKPYRRAVQRESTAVEPEIVPAPEVPDVPEMVDVPDVVEVPDVPDVVEVPESREVPEGPGVRVETEITPLPVTVTVPEPEADAERGGPTWAGRLRKRTLRVLSRVKRAGRKRRGIA